MKSIVPHLVLEDVSFSFEKRAPLFFHNVSVSFPAHTMSFMSGKNGSGKTTLFRIMSGSLQPWEHVRGFLTFPSQPNVRYVLSNHLDPERSGRVKIVQQNFDTMIADQFTFLENLQLANLPLYPALGKLPAAQPIPRFIERFQIDFTKPASLLSGGQRQILAILMALQKPTEVLLLDEPTAALDERNATMVMDFLSEFLKEGALTIIVICHDYGIIKRYAHDFYYFLDTQSGDAHSKDDSGGSVLRQIPVASPLYA